jgi:repressor LexA
MNVTPRQLDILRLIRKFRSNRGYSPTMQELADQLGVSKVTVFQHIGALADKGLIRKSRHRARSLTLTSKVKFQAEEDAGMPLLGYIAAGAPVEAIQGDQKLDVASMFSGPGEQFVLQVRGQSMIDEQIRDGDYVVVRPEPQPQDGQTVVALLEDGEVTLKRFYREGDRIRLQPANEAYEPIYVPADKLTIQGVVVGIMRRYG